MYSSSQIREALRNANVKAFLRCIRHGESNQTDDAYTIINGGAHFSSFAAHPFGTLRTTEGGKASGAFGFLPTTWADVAKRYPEDCPDFSPKSQDFGAVVKIADRGALEDLLAGNLDLAIAKCRKEWTSLPGASESAPGSTIGAYRALYKLYGGSQTVADEQPAAPVEDHSIQAEPTQGTSMPLVLALMPVLAQLLPQLMNVFKPGQEPTARVTAAAQVVSDAVVAATGTPNLQAAIEKITSDPAAKAAATEAVNSIWFQITEVGGGIQAARKSAMEQSQVPVYKNVTLIVTVLLLPLVYLVCYAVLLTPDYSEQLRTVVVTAIVLSLLGGITGFFYGTSLSSNKKDDTIAAQAGQPTGA